MTKINLKLRHKARTLALQALYQWKLSSLSSAEIEAQFLRGIHTDKVDMDYFLELLRGVTQDVNALDETIKPALDRSIESLYPVELSILRMAIYEFIHRLDVPYRVIINEALELAKTYGASDGFKYVNGVLDKIAQNIRTVEISEKGK